MADVVKFTLELADKVTPNGKRVQKTLTDVKGSVSKFSAATTVGGKAAKSFGVGTMSMVKGLVAASGVMAALDLGKQAVGMAFGAQAFKEKSQFALGILLKSGAEGKKAYDQMLRMSQFFGEDPTEMLEGFQTLLAKGFKTDDAIIAMQALGDLKLTSPDANMKSLTTALGQIKSKPKLALEELKTQLGDAGLDLGKAYEEIGKQIGVKALDVEKTISAGKVDSTKGLVGIMKAIVSQSGGTKAGEQMEKFSRTTSGLANTLKNMPDQYMLRLNVEGGPLQKLLAALVDNLSPDSPNGKKILAFLDSMASKLTTAIGNIDVDKVKASIDSFSNSLDKVGNGIGVLTNSAKSFSAAFEKVAGPFSRWLNGTKGAEGPTINWAKAMNMAGTALGFLAGIAVGFGERLVKSFAVFYTTIGAFIATGQKFAAWIGSIVDVFKGEGLMAALKKVGSDIVDGLWNGLTAAWKGMIEKFKGLVELLPASVKKVLGIASPSKVFMELGRFSMEGFERGVNDNAVGVKSAVTSAVQPPTTASAGGSGGKGSFSWTGNVIVQVQGSNASARDIGNAAADAVENQLAAFVERLAVESGVAA